MNEHDFEFVINQASISISIYPWYVWHKKEADVCVYVYEYLCVWVWHARAYNVAATLAYLYCNKSTDIKLKLQITQMTSMEGNLWGILYF